MNTKIASGFWIGSAIAAMVVMPLASTTLMSPAVAQSTPGPPIITLPRHGSKVTSPIIVQGVGARNHKIEVNVTAKYQMKGRYLDRDLGTFKVDADRGGRWKTTPINLWLPTGAVKPYYTISARQRATVDGPLSGSRGIAVLPGTNIVFKSVGSDSIVVKAPVDAPFDPKKKPADKPPINDAPILVDPPSDAPPLLAKRFAIKTPKSGAIVNSKMAISGTGLRGKEITVTVSSNYLAYKDEYYKPNPVKGPKTDTTSRIKGPTRILKTRVAADGRWETAPVDFTLDNNQEDGKFSITVTDGKLTKSIDVKNDQMATGPSRFSVTSHRSGAIITPNSSFRLLGTAKPDSIVRLVVTYDGVSKAINKTGPFGISTPFDIEVEDGEWGTYETRAGSNGLWSAPALSTSPQKHSEENRQKVPRLFRVAVVQIDETGYETDTRNLIFPILNIGSVK